MKIGADGRYHFLYKTVNKLTGKFYIGKHSTSDLDDGYIGSGIALLEDVSSIGKSNFSREILKFFDTKEEAYAAENLIVTEELIADPLCYNRMIGGFGGFDHLNGEVRPLYDLIRAKARESKTDEENAEIGRKKARFGESNGMFGTSRSGEMNPRFGAVPSERDRANISNALKEYYKDKPGTRLGHKNKEETNKRVAEANSKNWSFLNPSGEVVRFKNLQSFCRDNGLNPNCMAWVHSGDQKQHKGWRRYEG